MLKELGCTLGEKDDEGRTAAHVAALFGQAEVLRVYELVNGRKRCVSYDRPRNRYTNPSKAVI